MNHRKVLEELRAKVRVTEELYRPPSGIKALAHTEDTHNQVMDEFKTKMSTVNLAGNELVSNKDVISTVSKAWADRVSVKSNQPRFMR
jgi:hypothetical protein